MAKDLYKIGVIGPNGRKVIYIAANSRREAVSQAWACGYIVVDCEYHSQDSGYGKNMH